VWDGSINAASSFLGKVFRKGRGGGGGGGRGGGGGSSENDISGQLDCGEGGLCGGRGGSSRFCRGLGIVGGG